LTFSEDDLVDVSDEVAYFGDRCLSVLLAHLVRIDAVNIDLLLELGEDCLEVVLQGAVDGCLVCLRADGLLLSFHDERRLVLDIAELLLGLRACTGSWVVA
jgi:hypothetical protein